MGFLPSVTPLARAAASPSMVRWWFMFRSRNVGKNLDDQIGDEFCREVIPLGDGGYTDVAVNCTARVLVHKQFLHSTGLTTCIL